jgi:hypothetical protein
MARVLRQNYKKHVLRKSRPAAPKGLYFTCGKCKHQIAESCLVSHVEKCCPGKKLSCPLCRQAFPVTEFIEHYKQCQPKKAVKA